MYMHELLWHDENIKKSRMCVVWCVCDFPFDTYALRISWGRTYSGATDIVRISRIRLR